MIPRIHSNVVTYIGVDLGRMKVLTSVIHARIRVNEHEFFWKLSDDCDWETAVMRARFDVIEIEMNEAFDKLRKEAIEDIWQKFAFLRCVRAADHEIFMNSQETVR